MGKQPEGEARILRTWRLRPAPPRRRRVPWWAVAVAAAAIAGAVWVAARPNEWRPPSGSPRFVSCTYHGYVTAWCSHVDVPVDPRRPGGPRISLRVAILPATERPSQGALFYLEGGPGGAATESAVRVNELFARVSRRRDVVLIDQRGTGGSDALACPSGRVRAVDAEAVTAYLRACFARLPHDVALDTTSVAADDLDAVRRALGYGRIDLYGGSYGATLAQLYLQRHPGSVRSAVLDGASLLDVPLYEREAPNAEHALGEVLRRCAGTLGCHRAFPRPRRELGALLARPARRVTVEAGTVTLGPGDVASTIAALSRTAGDAASIPYALHAAVRGDYTPLARAYLDRVGTDLDGRARLATVWVTLCSEPWAGFDPVATARAAGGSYLRRVAVARAQLFERACRVVPRGRVPPGFGTVRPVRASVLLLAGGADPLDPVANLSGWRRVFPHGRLVVVPGAGHGAIDYGCVPDLVARFVGAPGAALDTSCVERTPLPPFQTG